MFFLENCLLSLIRHLNVYIYLIVINFYYRCDYLSV